MCKLVKVYVLAKMWHGALTWLGKYKDSGKQFEITEYSWGYPPTQRSNTNYFHNRSQTESTQMSNNNRVPTMDLKMNM